VELMKQAGRNRRPFQVQAIALLLLCHFLSDKFKAIGKSAVTVENINSLGAYVLLLSTETFSSDLDIFHQGEVTKRCRLPRPRRKPRRGTRRDTNQLRAIRIWHQARRRLLLVRRGMAFLRASLYGCLLNPQIELVNIVIGCCS
jgi:hypothetical protein